MNGVAIHFDTFLKALLYNSTHMIPQFQKFSDPFSTACRIDTSKSDMAIQAHGVPKRLSKHKNIGIALGLFSLMTHKKTHQIFGQRQCPAISIFIMDMGSFNLHGE